MGISLPLNFEQCAPLRCARAFGRMEGFFLNPFPSADALGSIILPLRGFCLLELASLCPADGIAQGHKEGLKRPCSLNPFPVLMA